MSPRTELHFHLLPGVDDGPRDLAETLELARMAVADGTRTITATPHVRDVVLDEIPGRVAEVRAALRAAGIPLAVRTGAELAHDDLPGLTDADLDAIAQGPPGARWLLLEAPLSGGDVDGLRAALAEVRDRGFGVLLGHPERCAALMQAGDALDAELAAGVRAQVNASALLGRHGEPARAWGVELVRTGRAHVLASDAHRPARGPVLTAALDALAARGVGRDRAERLVADHPAALLERGLPVLAGERRAA
ncbi:MAG TPA: CpsB/CapC family capsule biosynthesis tyrosine phosphatase, partial [Solirubrobacteraceae bacterium]|nr:CpsB/CapC family capsule biosynthesis tyrosine phosphatase [Solirubrobacteraceae bacterium]